MALVAGEGDIEGSRGWAKWNRGGTMVLGVVLSRPGVHQARRATTGRREETGATTLGLEKG